MFQQYGKEADHAGYANLKEHLKGMTADELRAELDALFEEEARSGEEAEPELVEIYLDALDAACEDEPVPGDMEKSWNTFKANNPDLFPKAEGKPRKNGFSFRRFFEAAVLVAALLVLSAAAFQWPDYVVSWGREILSIGPPESGNMVLEEVDENGYASLAEAVESIGVTDLPLPSWIPPSFSIRSINTQNVFTYVKITAVYSKEDNTSIAIRVSYYPDSKDMPNLSFEKNDDGRHEIDAKDGIEFFFTENYGSAQVGWINGNCLCSISGEISKEELKEIVNSIDGG